MNTGIRSMRPTESQLGRFTSKAYRRGERRARRRAARRPCPPRATRRRVGSAAPGTGTSSAAPGSRPAGGDDRAAAPFGPLHHLGLPGRSAQEQSPRPGELREVDVDVRPVAGLTGVGAHARHLSQHERRLLGRADPLGRGEHVDRAALERSAACGSHPARLLRSSSQASAAARIASTGMPQRRKRSASVVGVRAAGDAASLSSPACRSRQVSTSAQAAPPGGW